MNDKNISEIAGWVQEIKSDFIQYRASIARNNGTPLNQLGDAWYSGAGANVDIYTFTGGKLYIHHIDWTIYTDAGASNKEAYLQWNPSGDSPMGLHTHYMGASEVRHDHRSYLPPLIFNTDGVLQVYSPSTNWHFRYSIWGYAT